MPSGRGELFRPAWFPPTLEMPSLLHPRRCGHPREIRPQRVRKPFHCTARELQKSCCLRLSSTGSQQSSRTLSRRSPCPDLTFLLNRICSSHRDAKSSEL